MKSFLVCAALFAASLAHAADEPPAKSESTETMKSLMLEDAKRKAAEAAAKTPASTAPAAKPEQNSESASASPPESPSPVPAEKAEAKTAATAAANARAAAEPASVLSKVEVKKPRITVLDVQLQEQEKAIAREEKNTKPTELDKALNNSKVANALSFLGGQSADFRANLAQERVGLMQQESDLIEAIAHANTKEERAELQKQLDELRSYRRDLEKSLR
jgi:hypothetical protein